MEIEVKRSTLLEDNKVISDTVVIRGGYSTVRVPINDIDTLIYQLKKYSSKT